MIAVNDLIELFQLMYKEHWTYVWGSAQKGCVDCSGAFVYAYKTLENKSIPHGSNAIARRWTVGEMLPISQARPGMAAFKFYTSGEEGYDLPERYRKGGSGYNGDLHDYYHIGLVDEDTHYVLNAKGTKQGFCRDALTAKNGWDCVAYLKDVEYDEREAIDMQATVVLPSGATGSTVNMRERPDRAAPIVAKVPVGSVVDVLEDKVSWCRIEYEGKTGWMMSNYLEYDGQDGESESLTPEEVEKIDAALKQIEDAVEVISGIVGRG